MYPLREFCLSDFLYFRRRVVPSIGKRECNIPTVSKPKIHLALEEHNRQQARATALHFFLARRWVISR